MNIFTKSFNKKILRSVITIVITMLWCEQLFAVPLSTDAYEGLDRLKVIVVDKQISNNDISKFIATIKDNKSSSDSKVVAILALSYAQDSDSLQLLKETSNIANNGLIAGTAQYAAFYRSIFDFSDSDKLNALFYFYGHSQNIQARLFTCNRIAVDYKEKAFKSLLLCAKHETSKTIQCDLLYYLSKTSNKDVLEQIAKENWDENIQIPEGAFSILRAITPGRDKEKYNTDMSYFIMKTIKDRLNNF